MKTYLAAIDSPLVAFSVIFIVLFALAGYFLRGALFSITSVAAQHAKIYAVAYVKGGALILLAMFAAFEKSFQPLTSEHAAVLAWWDWAILFLSPITAGLAVLVAFLDKSKDRADQVAATMSTPPFQSSPPPTP